MPILNDCDSIGVGLGIRELSVVSGGVLAGGGPNLRGVASSPSAQSHSHGRQLVHFGSKRDNEGVA